MSLGSALSIASSGLYAVQGQISVVSQNVANANSPGYTEEVVANVALVNNGQPGGVALGVATRITAPALQTSLYTQNAAVGSQSVLNNVLTAITSVEGSTTSDTGSTGSLTAAISGLQAGFTALQADPSSSAQQQTVLQNAQTLAAGINSLASTYAAQRQAASDAMATGVASINKDLAAIGSLSTEIVRLRVMNQSTAGLEDQRSKAMADLSNQVSVKFAEQPSGNMLVTTTSGTMLPTNAINGPLVYQSKALNPGDSYDGSGVPVSNITLDGQDVTTSLTGGALGANIQLRDRIIPGYTAQLDSLAATVSQRLSGAGFALFTDGSGAVPPATGAPPTGLSSDIQVSTDAANLLSTIAPAAIQSINQYAFGAESAAGVLWNAPVTSIRLPYSMTGTLSDFASRLISSQGSDAQNATSSLADETAVQTAINGQIGNATAVSIDSEMSKMVALQNSYQANAKVISAIQSMYTSLLSAVGNG